MRSSFGPERLLLASKKKKIIDLIEQSKSMSIEEIKNLNEKPDVIRGLVNIKLHIDQKNALSRAEQIADAMVKLHQKNL